MDVALEAFKALDWVVTAKSFCDFSRNVFIAFVSNRKYVVEFVSTLNGEHPSPVDFLQKSKIPGNGIPYHICYECESIEKTVMELEKSGYRQIVSTSPAPAIGGRNVTFLFNKAIGLIELLERGN